MQAMEGHAGQVLSLLLENGVSGGEREGKEQLPDKQSRGLLGKVEFGGRGSTCVTVKKLENRKMLRYGVYLPQIV